MPVPREDPIASHAVSVPPEIEAKVMTVFTQLPLADKLIVYGRFRHGNAYKPVLGDLFGTSRHKATAAISGFLRAVREA